MEYGVNFIFDYLNSYSIVEVLKSIKKAGFTHIFYSFDGQETMEHGDFINLVRENGLEISSIHAPFVHANHMWKDNIDEDVKVAMDDVKNSIIVASKYNIKTVVIHYYFETKYVEVNQNGLDRFEELIKFAKEHNVVLALENIVEHYAYFIALADSFFPKYDNFRFCFDVGHDGFNFYKFDILETYKKYLVYTHIHDNEGLKYMKVGAYNDTHLLPFDGNLKYSKFVNTLKEIKYNGPIVGEFTLSHWAFDTEKHQFYRSLTCEEFYKLGIARLKQIFE